MVMDRAYGKLERLKRYKTDKQSFVIRLRDFEGREIRVVTDLMQVKPEQIAQIYKDRWQIEVFFRWIKQHLNIPTLFGTTENAVYGKLFVALMVYVLLKWLFDSAKHVLPRHAITHILDALYA